MADTARSYPIVLFAAGRIESDGTAISRYGADFRSDQIDAGHYRRILPDRYRCTPR